ncbi:prolyl endopeptidase [Xylaria sp. CBS 124048]|nr:prolyl endopeptidase [Xylaria sp. CBS 124048]
MSSNASSNPLSEAQAHLRIARPTDAIPPLLRFYVDGLGFVVAMSFAEHEGFDGVMLTLPPSSQSDSDSSAPGYHLEFTRHNSHRAGRAPTQDNLLIFYMADEMHYQGAVSRMRNAGFEPVKSFNPYWDRCGTTFEDPDGYRVVLANTKSPV